MRRRKHQAASVMIPLLLLLTHSSFAQRVEVSAVGGATIAPGVGVRLKISPASNGWNINGSIFLLHMTAWDPGGFEPGGTTKFMMAHRTLSYPLQTGLVSHFLPLASGMARHFGFRRQCLQSISQSHSMIALSYCQAFS